MLVVGDFSFKEKGDRISDREKISINKNNFTQVMESMDLKLKYNVENKLTGEGDLSVDMDVKNMDSFKPENVAKSVPALSKMLAARNLLKDLKSNLLDNREFRKRLEAIIKDPTAVKSLQEELKKVVPETKDPEQPKK
jgi:type VI secretion system protein ImpB